MTDRAGFVLGTAMVMLALVAGLNFTFSVAVMPNLAGVDDRTFVEVTQRFNENPVFRGCRTNRILLVRVSRCPGLAGAK